MSPKIFDNDLIAIRKGKVTLTLNKPAYVSMCIIDLSKVLMYKFHFDYTKNQYGSNSRLLFTDTDSLMFEVTEDVYEDFSKDKDMFDFSNYSAESKHYDDSDKLVVDKTKYGTCSVAIKTFYGLNSKMYSFLVDDSSEYKKTKSVNKNVAATTRHGECKDALLNKTFLRHSMNSVQNKNHRIGSYKIIKISLSCCDYKIYILNKGCSGVALGY